MRKLAIALSTMLILGILGAGVLAKNENSKSYGKGGKYGEESDPSPGNGKGWGKGGNPDKQEGEGTVETTGEETTTEATGEGKNKPTPKHPADSNGLRKTNGKVKHLYLYEKNETWYPVVGGAWGKMTYRPSGKTFRYTLSAHGLEPGANYSLIYYPDPWPGAGLICLGNGTANNGGNVQISDRLDIADIPTESDANYENGAKIWLVLTNDVDCWNQQMIGWNPTEYLFEYDLITYEDTG
jgi:hypothetical protein